MAGKEQEKIIIEYLDKIEGLHKEIDNQKPTILKNINLTKLMANPEEYIYNLGKEFYKSNKKNIKKAIDAGTMKSKKMLGDIDG